MRKVKKQFKCFLFVSLFILLIPTHLTGAFQVENKKISTSNQELRLPNTLNIPLKNKDSGKSSHDIVQPARTALPQKQAVPATSPKDFGEQSSISGLNLSTTEITVIQNGNVHSTYVASEAGLHAALYAIYNASSANSSDFVIYFAKDLSMGDTVTKDVLDSPNASNMNFASLDGHAKSISLISSKKDSLDSPNTASVSGSATISMPSNVYFGTPIVFRNITMSGNSNIYAQGKSLAFTVGSWFTGNVNIYGGTDSTDINSDTNVYVGATGSGTWRVFGGNDTGGTISGNTHVSIAGTSASGQFRVLSGGSKLGSVINGNTNLSLTSASLPIYNIFGGGQGSTTDPVTVKGSVINSINSADSQVRYNIYSGGVIYGNISGSVYNSFTGLGGWTTEGESWLSNWEAYPSNSSSMIANYTGGSFRGNIGTSGSGDVVSNQYDTSQFVTGQALFTGANGGISQTYQLGTAAERPDASTGIIHARVTNYIRTGSNGRKGALYGVVGGNGHNAIHLTPKDIGLSSSTDTNYGPNITDAQNWSANNPATLDANVSANAVSAIYGDIYTWLQGGVMSTTSGGGSNDWNGYSYGGSVYGYVKGSTIIELGTPNADGSVGGTGMVYPTSLGDTPQAIGNTSYSTTDSSKGNNSGWDVVGGGGPIWTYRSSYWQTGDSYIIHQNDISRWTYGGNFGGFQYGNSYNILNAGIVDTLEGGGYTDTLHFGNSNAQVNNGQVNWFLSGGSWGTLYLKGNTEVDVIKGTINGITGGNYGQAGSEIIEGNSTVNIFGGDFSGSPRSGTKQLCGGTFYNGGSKITGNTVLNVDLRESTGNTFRFPNDTRLSGGSGYSNYNNITGTDENNTITLNISTNKNTGATALNQLEKAVLYGDGTTNAQDTKSGKIFINITGPGAKIGSVYATNYSNISNGKINKNVSIYISDGTTIVGSVLGSAQNDNYTHNIAAASSSTSELILGDRDTSPNEKISVSGILANFTNILMKAHTNLDIEGKILNGQNATAGNHAWDYYDFGNFVMEDNSVLHTNDTEGTISVGTLTVGKDCIISTPYLKKAGVINLSGLDISKGNIKWLPTGTAPTSITNQYSGVYWGIQSGFPVLTFNGGSASEFSGAKGLNPENFEGIDSENSYAFLGDYTQSSLTSPSNPTWVGYLLPGQIRQFTSSGDSGKGNWQYNLQGVTTGKPVAGSEMKAFANVGNQTNAPSITLRYTLGYQSATANPFTFTASAPAYVNSRKVTNYKDTVLNDYPNLVTTFDAKNAQKGAIRTFSTSDYFVGNQQDGSQNPTLYGSYLKIDAEAKAIQTLSAHDIIMTVDEAKSLISNGVLDEESLEKKAELTGTGLLDDVVLRNSQSVINGIQRGISAGEAYSVIPLDFWNVTARDMSNLYIVPNGTVINSTTVVAAQDATISSSEAAKTTGLADVIKYLRVTSLSFIDGRVTVDSNVDFVSSTYHNPTTGADEVLNDSAHLLSRIVAAHHGNYFSNTVFSYTKSGVVYKSQPVTLKVIDNSLVFVNAPESLNFGLQTLKSTATNYWGQLLSTAGSADIQVSDSRTSPGWSLYVTEDHALSANAHLSETLADALHITLPDGQTVRMSVGNAILFYNQDSSNLPADGFTTIGKENSVTVPWGDNTHLHPGGFSLKLAPAQGIAGDYSGSILWSLNNVPLIN